MHNTELTEPSENALKALANSRPRSTADVKTELNDHQGQARRARRSTSSASSRRHGATPIEMAQKVEAPQVAGKREEDQRPEALEARSRRPSKDEAGRRSKTALQPLPAGATSEDEGQGRRTLLRKKAVQRVRPHRGREPRGLHRVPGRNGPTTRPAEVKALSVNSDPHGGYLVMPEMGGIIQTRVFETSPMRQLASVTTIGTDTLRGHAGQRRGRRGWVGETARPPDDQHPDARQADDLLSTSCTPSPRRRRRSSTTPAIDIEAWLAAEGGGQVRPHEATAFVSGNGVNKPKGLLSYDRRHHARHRSRSSRSSPARPRTFTYDGLVDLQNALKEDVPGQRVVPVPPRRPTRNLMMIKDGDGRPIFNMTFDKNVGLQPTLMGQPCTSPPTCRPWRRNALALAYGDFRAAYQIVDRTGIRVLRDPYTDKPNVGFYTTKRVGGGVVNFEAVKIQKIAAR